MFGMSSSKGSVYRLYFDGACRGGNPTDRIGCGLVIYHDERRIFERSWRPYEDGSYLTNNQAEYEALLCGLDWFIKRELEHEHIICHGDSQLVIYQLWPDPRFGRRWEIKKSRSSHLAREARHKLRSFTCCEGVWISREQNMEADRLSKRALEDSV